MDRHTFEGQHIVFQSDVTFGVLQDTTANITQLQGFFVLACFQVLQHLGEERMIITQGVSFAVKHDSHVGGIVGNKRNFDFGGFGSH